LSRDKAYLAERQGLKLPLLPVVGKDEKALFNRLMVKCPNDFENMASEWSKAVNGVSVFPKIPAQLRIYAKKWEKSVAVKKVLEDSAAGRAKVKEILSRYAVDTVPAPTMPLPISPTPVEVAPSDRAPPDSGAKPGAEIAASLNTVAGLCMQVDNPSHKSEKRKHGERGKDVKPRKKRGSHKCRRCLDNGGSDQQATKQQSARAGVGSSTASTSPLNPPRARAARYAALSLFNVGGCRAHAAGCQTVRSQRAAMSHQLQA